MVLLLNCKVLETKSIPTVGWKKLNFNFENDFIFYYEKNITWSRPVNVSDINLVIIDVFPTDWSPTKTNLYFNTACPFDYF